MLKSLKTIVNNAQAAINYVAIAMRMICNDKLHIELSTHRNRHELTSYEVVPVTLAKR